MKSKKSCNAGDMGLRDFLFSINIAGESVQFVRTLHHAFCRKSPVRAVHPGVYVAKSKTPTNNYILKYVFVLIFMPALVRAQSKVNFSDISKLSMPALNMSVKRCLIPAPAVKAQYPAQKDSRSLLKNLSQRTEITPPPLTSFKGVTGNQTIIPLNPGVACNANYIMEVTNQQYTIYNRAGDSLMSVFDNNFYELVPGAAGIYDPKILNDVSTGRWFISTGLDGYGVTLAVSATSDPTGDWFVYRVSSADSGIGFQDYPCMGYSDSLIIISANDYINYYGKTSQPDYTYNSFFVINKIAALAGVLQYKQVIDTNKFGLYPAQNFDNSDTVWNVGYLESYEGTAYYYISYFAPGSAYMPATLYGYAIGGNYTVNTEAAQRGTSNNIYTGDGRVQPTPSVRNGLLLFCNAMSGPDTGTSFYNYAQWCQVNPGNGAMVQNGQVMDPGGDTTYFFPSVMCDSKGNIMLVYNVTSDSLYISAAYSLHRAADAPGYMSPPFIYAPGVSPYFVNFNVTGEPNRWGDNNMVAYDAGTDGFCFVVEVSNDTNAAGQRIWYSGNYGDSRGVIGLYAVTPAPCNQPAITITPGNNTATVSPANNEAIMAITYLYKPVNTSAWLYTQADTIVGLSPCTNYDFLPLVMCYEQGRGQIMVLNQQTFATLCN
jgi:hypothetical protein